jgi:hypothetical protein
MKIYNFLLLFLRVSSIREHNSDHVLNTNWRIWNDKKQLDLQQFPAGNLPARILMGPGPSMVDPRVYQAMAAPLVGHLDLNCPFDGSNSGIASIHFPYGKQINNSGIRNRECRNGSFHRQLG